MKKEFDKSELLNIIRKVKYKMEKREEYYRNFMEKNKEMISEKHICEVCYGSYTYFHKSAHNKSKRHIRALEMIEKKKEEK